MLLSRRGQTSWGLEGHTKEFGIYLEGARKPLKMSQWSFLLKTQKTNESQAEGRSIDFRVRQT